MTKKLSKTIDYKRIERDEKIQIINKSINFHLKNLKMYLVDMFEWDQEKAYKFLIEHKTSRMKAKFKNSRAKKETLDDVKDSFNRLVTYIKALEVNAINNEYFTIDGEDKKRIFDVNLKQIFN